MLDGDGWRCRPFLGDEWQGARLGEQGRPGRGGWLPARVPGTVVADLLRAGQVPDPQRDLNSRFAEWAAARWWAYQTDFDAPAARPGERVQLLLEGIDYSARLYLDGELLGEHEGMFVPASFELTEQLRAGRRHRLAVLIAPAPPGESQSGDSARVRTHKTRMSYGWDFCPRLVQQGLWQPVWLRRTGPVRIEQPLIQPRLSADHATAEVACRADLDAARGGTARVDVAVRLAGATVARAAAELQLRAGRSPVELLVPLAEPALWWPNGYGERPLYEVEVRAAIDGRMSDRVMVNAGVRSVRLEGNEGAPAGARPYRFVVNGVPVYVNGWNWVPIDILYGVPRPAKLAHLLRLAQAAHVNLLRVWGGGLIESEEFYAACDRLGILVWQEFIQSSSGTLNAPAEDADFVALMAREAEQIVVRRRNHPSLALWSGGNELMRDSRPLDESAPVLAALRDVVRRLDPDRPFLPTSPSGPVALFADLGAGEVGHDVHGPWEHRGVNAHQQLYDGRSALLHSEFGVEGMANRATIEATISPYHRWPPVRDNAVYAHRGAWWINESLVQATFGGGIDDLATMVRASQLLQADGLRYAVEANLRRRWLSSGTLPWQFNEPFANAWCTSVVDYFGRPKPAYHAVAAAYEPLHVSAAFARRAWAGAAAFAAQIWATSTHRQEVRGTLVARCVAADGSEAGRFEAQVACPGLASRRIAELHVPMAAIGTDAFLLDITLGDGVGSAVAESRYLFSRTADLAPLRALPPVALQASRAEIDSDAWQVTLRNRGGWLAPALRIEDGRPADAAGWTTPETDHVTLLPGETRTVRVAFDGVAEAERRLLVSGWNVEERVVV